MNKISSILSELRQRVWGISLLKTMNSGLNNGEQRESIKLRSVDN